MSKLLSALGINLLAIIFSLSHASTPNVAVTIKPIFNLTTAIMEGAGAPTLLIEGASSPHNYQLRPRQAELISKSDLLIWIGPQLESRLNRAVNTLTQPKNRLTLLQQKLPVLLPLHELHDHDSHGHDSATDPHIWLNPKNAIAIAKLIGKHLRSIDETHANLYKANEQKLVEKIKAQEKEIHSELKAIKNLKYLSTHRSLQYFEAHYDLAPAGPSLTLADEHQIGAKSLQTFKQSVAETRASCIFYEPFTNKKLISLISQDNSTKAIMLDPIGTSLENESYIDIIDNIVKLIKQCKASAL